MERDEEGPMRSENPGAVVSGALPRLEPLRSVRTDALEVAYFEAGPSDGDVALLLHGFPYDIHSYVDVIPAWQRRAIVSSPTTCVGMDPPASLTAPPRARDSKQPLAAT